MQKDESLESFFDRCHAMAAPLYVVSAVCRASRQFLFDMNEKNKERNAQIAALEARVTAIDDRGLDARPARRTVRVLLDRNTRGRDALPFSVWHLDPRVYVPLVTVDGFPSRIGPFTGPDSSRNRGVAIHTHLLVDGLVNLPFEPWRPAR
jgi:hypothetical protein